MKNSSSKDMCTHLSLAVRHAEEDQLRSAQEGGEEKQLVDLENQSKPNALFSCRQKEKKSLPLSLSFYFSNRQANNDVLIELFLFLYSD